MNRKKVLAGLVVALAAAGVVTLVVYRQRQAAAQHSAGAVRVSGNIEVTDADVSFKIAGRVIERAVDEGELVKRGDLVARLDTADLESEVAVREAELQAAQAALDELLAGSRPEEIAEAAAALEQARAFLAELEAGSRPQEIAAAEATVATARANLVEAETNYNRVRDLHERQMAASQEYDTARAAYEARQAQLQEAIERLKLVREGPRAEDIAQARAALAQAEERFKLVQEGPRVEVIAQGRARVAQAQAALGLAQTRLGYATVTSPLSGVVLSKNIEPGEYVVPGTPVVTVGDLQDIWLRAYVDETDLGRVKYGQPVRVTTDTYPGKVYDGRISFISSAAEFTPRSVQTPKERVKLVYRVKIDIANPELELKPGMPADAEILVQ